MNKIFNRKAMLFWLYFVASLVIVSAVLRLLGMSEFMATGKSADPADQHYVSHLWITLIHLIPGTLFILLGPLQFSSSIRNRWPQYHRWAGRIALFCGLFTAIAGLVMNATFPAVGGMTKAVVLTIFGIFQIVALLVAWRAIMQRKFDMHRDWMIRAYAIALSVSTMRFFMIPYFILFGMPSEIIIDIGTGFSFLFNWLIAEMIIHKLRKHHG